MKTTTRKRKRGYQRGFWPKAGSRGREFKVREVPPTFFARVNAKAKREGVSVRGLILTQLEQWLEAGAEGAGR
jgi:hypothetical protein